MVATQILDLSEPAHGRQKSQEMANKQTQGTEKNLPQNWMAEYPHESQNTNGRQ